MALRPLPRPSGDTLRRFLFEIATITLGILIALWIDELREARRDAGLVRSARAQLAREIADNQRDVRQTAPSRDAHMKALAEGLRALDALRTSGTPLPKLPMLGLSSPSFPRSAWDTAGRTGALALMDYPVVKAYTELYDLQDLVDRAQERYRQLLAEASAEFFLATQRPAAFGAGSVNLQVARSQGLTLLGAFETYRTLMAQLVTQYETASKL